MPLVAVQQKTRRLVRLFVDGSKVEAWTWPDFEGDRGAAPHLAAGPYGGGWQQVLLERYRKLLNSTMRADALLLGPHPALARRIWDARAI